MTRVLHRAGLSEEQARSAYGALHTYTTTGQFIQGLHYMLQGISSRAGTTRHGAT